MDMKETILSELEKIEEQYGVRVLHAVESGSRAWGFASPDSDYDVRFVYVRPAADYLRLDEPRDVIEWKTDEVLDINGWDLKKALLAFAKGNPNIMEWANSPIIYRKAPEWDGIRELLVRTPWEEKPCILYDLEGGSVTETWLDTAPPELNDHAG